jgi:hypothetical protein
MTAAQLIAVVLLIVSVVFALINPTNLQQPMLWAVWAGVVLYVLGSVLGARVF